MMKQVVIYTGLIFCLAGSPAAKTETKQTAQNSDTTQVGLVCRDLGQSSWATSPGCFLELMAKQGLLQTCPIPSSKSVTPIGDQIDPEFTKLLGSMMDPKMVYLVDPAIDIKIFPPTMRPFRAGTKSPN